MWLSSILWVVKYAICKGDWLIEVRKSVSSRRTNQDGSYVRCFDKAPPFMSRIDKTPIKLVKRNAIRYVFFFLLCRWCIKWFGDCFYFLFNVFLIFRFELGNDRVYVRVIHPVAFKLHNNYDHDKNLLATWMHFFSCER